MNSFRIWFCFAVVLLTLQTRAQQEDKQPSKPKFAAELKAGSLLYLVSADAYSTDLLHAKPSATYNLGLFTAIKKLRIGVHVDRTYYKTAGSIKQVGTRYKSNSTDYYIRQQLFYNYTSVGFSLAYVHSFHRFTANAGLSMYYIITNSDLWYVNSYAGSQPDHGFPLPPDHKKEKVNGENDVKSGGLPYATLDVQASYRLGSFVQLGLWTSLNYDAAADIYGNSYGGLPQQCIYDIQKLLWLNAGLSLRVGF